MTVVIGMFLSVISVVGLLVLFRRYKELQEKCDLLERRYLAHAHSLPPPDRFDTFGLNVTIGVVDRAVYADKLEAAMGIENPKR